MTRRLKRAALVLVVAVVAAQLIRPTRTNPPIDPTQTLQAQPGTSPALAAVLDRSCRDCHSNSSDWPGAASVAPASWLMASAVSKGREAVNFSTWASYPLAAQRKFLTLSCQDARTGKMPGVYTWVRPASKLSAPDIQTICAASAEVEAAHAR